MTRSPPVPGTKPLLPAGALSRLQSEMNFLSPSLKKVATHVLVQPEQVIYQTISELADAAQVAESTITRLSHRLDFAGFHAFKLALTGDLSGHNAAQDIGNTGSTSEIIAGAAQQATQALDNTRSVVDPAAVDRVVEALRTARRIDVVGQGNSGLAAQFLAHKLQRLGRVCLAHTDPHLAAVAASSLEPGCVLIGITRSGSTLDTIQTLRLAEKTGAFTVAVTNRARSPVTAHAQEVLHTSSPESPLAGGAISSLASQILIVEVLYLSLTRQLERAQDVLRTTAASVVEKKI
ncbi:MurR/RpiR family transcriptional regulator (plasmid) [Deinococcus sp. KNUC1210]|uniref:MurR/RpiR family transcriptional regulator n=1 Tax=Deinococcus sp. KNUC1210 TaxID=2917691 RepID=UPI001EEF831A|nr:MurR/RpiR family transcriptional regulator [Deinococcus sp. KNUC1210]ULH14306.1 MurR/RpiR family transcriptional regulator [Deinococcus sp. KNUC1210]